MEVKDMSEVKECQKKLSISKKINIIFFFFFFFHAWYKDGTKTFYF